MKLENDLEKGIFTGLIILFFIIAFNYYPISWRLILPFVGGIIFNEKYLEKIK